MHRFSAIFRPSLGGTASVLLALVLALPTLAVVASVLQWTPQSVDILRGMASTVLTDHLLTTVLLCVGVAVGVTVLGVSTALAVALFEFRGRAVFEWLLLLPLAMPAYVLAYAYTDFLQFSGAAQTFLRASLGLSGALWPDVRSVWGAVLVFSLSLYPYVYVLVRTALVERSANLMEAARMLGASLPRRIFKIALALARPAWAAGLALALMETMADYGVSSYFGIQTFTAGIYKAWLAMDDRIAAAQLATLLLLLVLLLLRLEQGAQKRMRFASSSMVARQSSSEGRAVRLGTLAQSGLIVLCAVPVLLAFVVPTLILVHAWLGSEQHMPWSRFGHWTWNSLRLAGMAAGLAVAAALLLSFAVRLRAGFARQSALHVVGLGYAIPGAVVVVGLLTPLAWLQHSAIHGTLTFWLTATSVGLLWAYLVRFTAVALQSVQSGYARISPTVDESSKLLGVQGWGLLWQVHLPLLKRSIGLALLLVFVDVMKELPATLVLRPFNSDTLAVVAYQLARDERLGEAALPALALVLVGLIPVLVMSRSLRSKAQGAENQPREETFA
jgi:iron(III) transport system permease protein